MRSETLVNNEVCLLKGRSFENEYLSRLYNPLTTDVNRRESFLIFLELNRIRHV